VGIESDPFDAPQLVGLYPSPVLVSDRPSQLVTADRYRITQALAVATCALTPAYVVRWHLGPIPTTILENAILLTVAAFVVESVRQKSLPVWRTPVTVPAILFLVAGAISIVVAPDHRAAIGLYRAYLIEPIAFGLVMINVVSTANRAAAIVAGLAAGATVTGIANAFVVVQALRHHTYDVVNTPPVIIYNTANAVALYLVPIIAFAGAVALHWADRTVRLIAWGLVLVLGLCVLLSFSRGGYLALLVVAVGLALSHRRRWLLLAGGVAATIVLMLIPTIGNRVRTDLDFSNGHNTLVGRFHLWSVALQMLRDHPIFGAGLSGFATVLGPYWNPTNIDRFTYPHNIVLNFWTEVGLLGLAAFAWIMVAGFIRSWGGWRHAVSDWRAVHLGVLLALVAVVVHGLVDVPYWKNDLSLEFWTLLSLTLAPAALWQVSRPAGRSPARSSGSAS
jgi:putative inorganic carbon (HCO3(-)) transporter